MKDKKKSVLLSRANALIKSNRKLTKSELCRELFGVRMTTIYANSDNQIIASNDE
jgi:hypothetical protein